MLTGESIFPSTSAMPGGVGRRNRSEGGKEVVRRCSEKWGMSSLENFRTLRFFWGYRNALVDAGDIYVYPLRADRLMRLSSIVYRLSVRRRETLRF